MKVRYFADTDTLLITLSDKAVVETHDLGENSVVDLDAAGRVVAITLEHARDQTDISEFSYQTAEA